MSKFFKLGPCPHCGSKDNRAEYENGFWCFGCSKLEKRMIPNHYEIDLNVRNKLLL